MLKTDNTIFCGKIRYMRGTIHSLNDIQRYETDINKVPKELVKFSNRSSFLNKLKKDRDVFLFYHKQLQSDLPFNKGFFAKLFGLNKTNDKNTDKEHLKIVFKNQKADNIKDTELCEINISLPLTKNTPKNFKRFDRILKSNTNIKELRSSADKLFPEDSHKLTLFPNGNNYCWIEFWKGEKNIFDTVDRLQVAFIKKFLYISEIFQYKNKSIG